jgi:protein-S-isoprenylcysteine O-methyltransferase Ste14
MKATAFEFRYRSLLNLIHFWIAFQLYSVDHVNVIWALVQWTNLRSSVSVHLIFAFGALLVGLAAALRTWAAAYLRSDVVHDPALHTEKLVADGPYRHLRNPLYLGTFLLCVGIGFLASRSGFVVLVGGAALRISRLIGREEDELAKQQGLNFREFCRRVPRLLPSLRSRVPSAGLSPQWGQAFRGEAFMWGFFITMIAFAITLQSHVAYILGGATLALWLLQRLARRRSKTAAA